MKEGWEYIDFKDVYPIKMGKTPPRGDKSSWDEKKETHNKWVSIADISNNEGKIIDDTKEYISDSAAEKINKVSKGSLLMSFKLSIGRMAFAGDDLYTNEAIIAIPESNKYNLRFIYYYLLSYNWLSLTEGNEKVKGATLNKSSIGKIQLPVLSIIEQQSIVDYLDSAFAKIDVMKVNAEKRLNEAKSLFQASLKKMLEPKEGWEYIAFKDVYPIKMGKTPPRGDKSSWDEKKETHNKWVSIADISNNEGKIIEDTKEYISDSAAEKIKKVSKGSLLMSFKLSIGRMAFAGDDLYTNEAIIAIPENEKYILRFIYYYLLSYDWLSLTEGNEKVKGATLNKTSIGKIQLPVLSLIEQQSIVATLDSLKSKVDRLQANYDKISQECNALKQAILRQVFE